MMTSHRKSPKCFDGRFPTFNYKDKSPLEKSISSGGGQVPAHFEPEHIENGHWKTKRKFVTLQGKCTAPLHLINDAKSDVFQISLIPCDEKDQLDKVLSVNNKYKDHRRVGQYIASSLVQSSKASDISNRRISDHLS